MVDKPIKDVLDILKDIIWQFCLIDENGKLDSMVLSAFVDGLWLLDRYGRVKIESH